MTNCKRCGGVQYPGLFEHKCECQSQDQQSLMPSNESWFLAAILVLLFLGVIPVAIAALSSGW